MPVQVDSDDEWLVELLQAHRAPVAFEPAEAGEAEGEWLLELLGAHRAADPGVVGRRVGAISGGSFGRRVGLSDGATGHARSGGVIGRRVGAAGDPSSGGSVGRRVGVEAPRAFVGKVPFSPTNDLQSLLEQEAAFQSKFGFGFLEEEEVPPNPKQDEVLWALRRQGRAVGQSGTSSAAGSGRSAEGSGRSAEGSKLAP